MSLRICQRRRALWLVLFLLLLEQTLALGFLLSHRRLTLRLFREKKDKLQDDEFAMVSITTMAEETLGEWGGALATVAYAFLGYTSMIAYCAKSGEILHHLLNFPESISGVLFTALFTILISVGGTRATDQVNQWLTFFMIGLLIVIEVIAVLFGGSSGFEGGASNWGNVPATLPIMILVWPTMIWLQLFVLISKAI